MKSGAIANKRIASGLQALDAPDVLAAFKIASCAIATSMRQRSTHKKAGMRPEDMAPPKWRPCQLAFLLINMAGIVDPEHESNAFPI